jgi:phage-related protein
MFTVKFYETKTGESDVWDFLEELRRKSTSNKDARVQYNQLLFCIDLLSKNGTFLPNNITKHIDEDIWELRPGNNRVLYFYCDNDAFVLLHHFRKKTMKTPPREIQRAKAECDDYIARKEANKK